MDLRILDFGGKNLRLKIDPLNGTIDPSLGKIKVKSNSITIELKKGGKTKFWDDIKVKKSIVGSVAGGKKDRSKPAVDS